MKIAEISPVTLKDVSNTELLSLHRRLHQLWGEHFEGNTKESAGGLTREDLTNAHQFVREEMERREMGHDSPLGSSRSKSAQLGWVPAKEGSLPDEIIVVPQFVSIVGSMAKGFEGDDLDVLLRTEKVGENKLTIWSDSVHLPLRKVLDPKKTGIIHWIANPQGPHSTSIPLYDLVMRRAKQAKLAEGLYLVEPHAEMIWSGGKTAIVKSRRFEVEGKRYILVSDGPGGKAWGKIELHPPKVITLDDFEKLRDQHLVTEAERLEWWKGYDKLYFYNIKYFVPFDQPKKVKVPRGVQTFIRDVELAAGWSSAEIKIDLGCGKSKPAGYIGLDNRAFPGVDILYDLELGLPFCDGYADEIRAHHVLEHLSYPRDIMYEIWRVLKLGGTLEFEVPSSRGEGAFAHPGHRSWWNKLSFLFYCDDRLRDEIGFGGKFEVMELEDVEKGSAVYTRGRLRAVANTTQPGAPKLAVGPWYAGPLPKPAMKLYTEFFSAGELWKRWAAQRIEHGLAVEEKLNGFRTLVQKRGDQVRIEFEDSRKDRAKQFPDLVEALKKVEGDFILDGNLGVIEDSKPWPRIRLMTLTSKQPQIPESASVVFTAFDVLHWKEDLTGSPLGERRRKLEVLVRSARDKRLAVSQQETVKTKAKLEKAVKKLGGLPGSEGVVVKTLDAVYPAGAATSEWAKVKHMVEIKAWVLEVKSGKAGTRQFRGGLLLGEAGYKNVVDFQDRQVVDLGYSFNASFTAKTGDVVTFEVEEVILQENGDLAWLGAKPVDIDRSRQQPYFAGQVVNLARRGHILQDGRSSKSKTQSSKLGIGEEGETRSEKAAKFWREHWHESFPKSGKGQFVYQHHWRGLSEDEAKAEEKTLLDTEHSVHGDLRCSFDGALWGLSVFLGKTADLRGGRDLENLPADDALQGAFKLHQPKAWLTVARKKPFIVEPGGPGSTAKTWSAFFEVDHGSYEIGVWREHFFELFLHGKKLKGRYMIQYAQQESRRYWQIAKPDDQTPYAEKHEKEAIIEELKRKGQRWLVWAKPGQRPELIDVEEQGDAS